MATPLLQLWLDQFGDRERISLADEMLPGLPGLVPPGLGLYIHKDSVAIRTGGNVRVHLSGMLQPGALPAFDPLSIRQARPFERSLDTETRRARHHLMRIPPGWRGQLRGRTAVRRSVDLYRDLGIERVGLLAVDDGRYVWAMCGFSFASPADRDHVFRAAGDFADRLGYDLDFGDVSDPWEIGAIEGTTTLAEIAEVTGATELSLSPEVADRLNEPMRLGKALLLFSDIQGWEGILDTSPESRGSRQLARYTEVDEALADTAT